MSEEKIYPVPEAFAARAHIDAALYEKMYKQSVDDPEGFWAEQAEKFVSWYKPWDKVLEWNYNEGEISWFEGAELNVCYNCVDRHLESRGDQVAIRECIFDLYGDTGVLFRFMRDREGFQRFTGEGEGEEQGEEQGEQRGALQGQAQMQMFMDGMGPMSGGIGPPPATSLPSFLNMRYGGPPGKVGTSSCDQPNRSS